MEDRNRRHPIIEMQRRFKELRAIDLDYQLEEEEDSGNLSSDPESEDSDEAYEFIDGIDPLQEREEDDKPRTATAIQTSSGDPGSDSRVLESVDNMDALKEIEEDDQPEDATSNVDPMRVRPRRSIPPAPRVRQSAKRRRVGSATAQQSLTSQAWKTENDPDICPKTPTFQPRRTPGVQVDTTIPQSPLDLFQLFFSLDTLGTLCKNTNKNAAKNIAMGKKYKWTDVSVAELLKYIGLLLFTSMLTLGNVQDYWRRNHIFSVPFPATVMSRDRFRILSWNIHLSDPDEDFENDKKKGTPHHDELFRLRPLLDEIRVSCQAQYHPRINLAIDERMVATKSKTGMTQCTKGKIPKSGFKLFVLVDSSNGYTVNLNVYTGKGQSHSENGLSYDSVMDLITPSYLGTGYHLYVDNFHTSPKLFADLNDIMIGACGTYDDNRKGFPSGRANPLNSKSPRGSVRWIREDPLLFLKWVDTHEVSMCSTLHQAHSGDMVKRKVQGRDGRLTVINIPFPTPIMAYKHNMKFMGGIDLSDHLIQYFSLHHKTHCWYRTLFLHFLDIATTNAYILHCDISKTKKVKPMTHQDFLEELTVQLCGTDKTGVPSNISRSYDHIPVGIAVPTDPRKKATQGRKKCHRCSLEDGKTNLTPWKCKACDIALCLILDRNCFEQWHL